jgi:hypothetical protein
MSYQSWGWRWPHGCQDPNWAEVQQRLHAEMGPRTLAVRARVESRQRSVGHSMAESLRIHAAFAAEERGPASGHVVWGERAAVSSVPVWRNTASASLGIHVWLVPRPHPYLLLTSPRITPRTLASMAFQ